METASTTSPIRIATRGSRLALWQAHHVADALRANGMEVEMVIITTKGDLVLDKSLDKIGAKGVFTEELEESLRNGTSDIAVHSAKDVQSTIPEDLELLAFMEREKVHDVVISFDPLFKLGEGQQVIGTSSTRRRSILKRFYPNVITAECRGNLQTRIQKLKDGQYDAILLAYAGVARMQYDHMIAQHLPLDTFIPAAGQGSIAIECAKTLPLERKLALKLALDHKPTHLCLLAERAYLRTMEGGCSIPTFALATLAGEELTLKAGIISLDGKHLILEETTAASGQAEAMGEQLAHAVLSQGGDRILQSIKAEKS
ncbi:hydroxymethylbilane synthase [Rufibacter glacialis]|uniref:Porphobilinogen deaminase n=1 Tax=Rufibacter glacialis TaxID=1259555 RepID=A0A5M8QSB1_9BACT|nr:hydroxymethylbilane synthase [Rufibacter glacialis]KAA6437546.1 hydroxymethylbilane synthase [Rufibacter glacialis]GGK58414.1 porphobilinogen deaminase [Rufibacter glacialis]